MNLSFIITTYQGDADRCIKLLRRVRELYPRSQVTVLTDGNILDPQLSSIRSLASHCILGEAISHPRFGSQWLERLLKAICEYSPTWYTVKLDPDSELLRRFHDVSEQYDLLRNAQCWGGCYVISSAGAKRLLESGVLKSLVGKDYIYVRAKDGRIGALEDKQLCDGMRLAGLSSHQWSELGGIRAKDDWSPSQISSVGLTFPVLHPVGQL